MAGTAQFTDPPALLAVLLAAKRSGDRSLERVAKRELAEHYGIEVKIKKTTDANREANRAS